MTLEEYCHSLTSAELFDLAIRICEEVLPIWDEYAAGSNLTYRDTVVGLHHKVRKDMLERSVMFCKSTGLRSAKKSHKLTVLLEEFSDPIVSLQDLDWELPGVIEKVFYAIYNLLGGINDPFSWDRKIVHYISVNQAADALEESGRLTVDDIRSIIYCRTH